MTISKGIQIDDGEFTRLHNSILDKLAIARFTASEYRCLMFLFRSTYGWQKREDAISLSQWAAGVGIAPDKRHNVLRTLQALIAKHVICATSNGNNHSSTWRFNKHFEQWDPDLFDDTVIPQDSTSVISPDNTEEPTVISEDNTSVISPDNSFDQSVISPDNTSVISQDNSLEASVISPDNRSVISPDNRSVISPDNNKRKERKIKESTKSTDPFSGEKDGTPQQKLFGAVCEAVGWDYRTLTEKDRAQVAQACGVLSKADYGVVDIRRFMVEIWFHDWRWEKHHQHPTLSQLRQEIGKIRSIVPEVAPPTMTPGMATLKRLQAKYGGTNDG
jgi:phage replication O-like protein O